MARVGAGAVVEGSRRRGRPPSALSARRLVGRRLAVDVAAELGPGRSIILEDPRVALAVMPLLPNGKAPAVRTQRDRSARQVCRRPAIDVAAELGPGRAGVLEDTRLASEKTSAGVGVRPDGEGVPSALSATEKPDSSPAASPSMSAPSWFQVAPSNSKVRVYVPRFSAFLGRLRAFVRAQRASL